MALPANYGTCQITGTWVRLSNGAPLTGRVIFTPSANRIVSEGNAIVVVRPITAHLVNGSINVSLPATNDPDISPLGFTYKVEEKFNDKSGQTYHIAAPVGGSVDLSTVVNVDPDTGEVFSTVPGPPGILPGYINASDFGLVPDTGTNQLAALTDAVNAAVTEGKRLVIPPGTFHTQPLVPPSGLRLSAFGKHTILRRFDSSSPHVLFLSNDDIVVEDIFVDGNASLGGATGSGAVTITGDNVTVRRLKVYNVHAHNIRVASANDVTIDDCHIVSTTATGGGIVYHGGGGGGIWHNFTVKNCLVDKSGATDGGGIGTALNQAGGNILRGLEIRNNRVFGASGAICIETFAAGVDDYITDAIIAENRTFGGTMGLSLPFIKGGTVTGNVDRWDGTRPGTGSWGIELVGCENTTCTGNSVYGRNVGITLNSGRHNIVSANTLKNIGVVNNAADSWGITCSAAISTPEGNLIAENIIDGCLGIGIGVRGDIGGFKVADNIIDGVAGDAAIQWGGFGGSSGKINCTSNKIRNCTNGIRFEGLATFTGIVMGNDMTESVTNKFIHADGATTPGVQFWANPPIKPVITGSRGGNAALADLLTELASLGVIDNQSTA